MDMARCLMRFAGSNNTPGSFDIVPLFCIISGSKRASIAAAVSQVRAGPLTRRTCREESENQCILHSFPTLWETILEAPRASLNFQILHSKNSLINSNLLPLNSLVSFFFLST